MVVLRLITFDVTGTLLTFRTPVIHQYVEQAVKHGIHADPELLQPQFKKAWKEFSETEPNFGRNSGLGWEEWWRQVVMKTFSSTTEEKPRLRNLANDLIQHFTTAEAWSEVDHGRRLLETLKARGFDLGVISNFDPRLHLILENMNMTQYFSFVATSYETGFEKPDPRIFDRAMELGGVFHHQSIHIGNDRDKDLEGARNVGIQAIIVSENEKSRPPEIVSSLEEVAQSINIMKGRRTSAH